MINRLAYTRFAGVLQNYGVEVQAFAVKILAVEGREWPGGACRAVFGGGPGMAVGRVFNPDPGKGAQILRKRAASSGGQD